MGIEVHTAALMVLVHIEKSIQAFMHAPVAMIEEMKPSGMP